MVPAGYLLKRPQPPEEWLKAPHVREVCSVSNCVNPGLINVENVWMHNDSRLANNPETLWRIASIQRTTQRAVEAICNITGTIRDINDSSTTIAAAVEKQGAATNEIVQAESQASAGTSEVTVNITGVARMATETGAGASQVLSASSELAHQVEHVRRQISAFISQIRAA